jgi:hypothetical protein
MRRKSFTLEDITLYFMHDAVEFILSSVDDLFSTGT